MRVVEFNKLIKETPKDKLQKIIVNHYMGKISLTDLQVEKVIKLRDSKRKRGKNGKS